MSYPIEPSKMEPVFFSVIYKDGSRLSQYEQTKDGSWIGNHWNDIKFSRVMQFEVWKFTLDQYKEPKTAPLMNMNVEPGMKLKFYYRTVKELKADAKMTRTTEFGFEVPGTKVMWSVDKDFKITAIGRKDVSKD